MPNTWIEQFVTESYRIEGLNLTGERLDHAVFVHENFLKTKCTVADLENFARDACGRHCVLREFPNQNVRVGSHIAPQGGPGIRRALWSVLDAMLSTSPFDTHRDFLTLHPFMDGNGRTGRAIWLWQLRNIPRLEEEFRRTQALGFLHTFYYQTLSAHDARKLKGVTT